MTEKPVALPSPEGTYACPICGCPTPHAHSPEQIAEWRAEDIAPELCERCMYCRGVPFVKRKAERNDAGLFYHYRHPDHYWDGSSSACLAQDIQTKIYRLMTDHFITEKPKAALPSSPAPTRNEHESGMGIYDCDDCGCRFAAEILLGTKGLVPHFVAACGSRAFVAYCPNCGGTMVRDIGPKPPTQSVESVPSTPSPTREANMVINGVALNNVQAMTVRVAIESFAMDLSTGLGDDEHGKAMTASYKARIAEIRKPLYGGVPSTPVETHKVKDEL